MGDETEGETASAFACPHCGLGVAFTPGATAQRLTCPHCGGEFVAPATDGSSEIPESDSAPADEPVSRDDELNALRIRHVAAERRARYRARSWCLIGAGVCAVATAELIWMIVRQSRAAGWGLQCTGYLLFALMAGYGASWFIARAWRMHRDARRSILTEPDEAPDFSTLDDGSKRVENLEDVR